MSTAEQRPTTATPIVIHTSTTVTTVEAAPTWLRRARRITAAIHLMVALTLAPAAILSRVKTFTDKPIPARTGHAEWPVTILLAIVVLDALWLAFLLYPDDRTSVTHGDPIVGTMHTTPTANGVMHSGTLTTKRVQP